MLFTILTISSLAIVLWCAGAIYFDAFEQSSFGVLAGAAWSVVWISLFIAWHPEWKPFTLLSVTSAGIIWWWFSQRPSQDRDWEPHFALVASATINGNVVSIDNVRNSEYSNDGTSFPKFKNRNFDLSQLRGADILVLTWGSPWMSHPILVFDFGLGGRLCISVEVRYRRGQRFSLIRSLYRQQELIYIVSDERDAILRRTKWLKGHDLYLYQMDIEEVALRKLFLDYVQRINELAAEPCWYHGLTTNCTTSLYSQSRDDIKWHWRMLVNGGLDRLLYDRGLISQHMPFESLKRASWINEIANSAPTVDFGDSIRLRLPGYNGNKDDHGRANGTQV